MAARICAIWLLVVVAHVIRPCRSDPHPLQDVCVADLAADHVSPGGYPCKPMANVTSDDFHFAGLAHRANITPPWDLGLNRVTVRQFPGLQTLGLSIIRADLGPGGIIPLHSHQRSSELVLVLKGRVLIGFVTSAGQFFSKVVSRGEIFAVPRGLVHFQQNVGKGDAVIMPVFESVDPGLSIAPLVLFGSKPALPTSLLAKTFQMEEQLVDSLKSKFGN